MKKIKKKVALVTGSSRGLGKSMALHFSENNIIPIITYSSNKNDAKQVQKKVSENIDNSSIYKLDISSRSSIRNLLRMVIKKYGKIDILVNNAGINQRCDFFEITDKDWDRLMGINLKGPFMMIQEAIPLMRAHTRIINISSVAGQYHGPTTVHYAVSKAALNSLTKATARYASKKNIYINAIAPGIILTDQTKAQFESGAASKIIRETQLIKRPGTLDDLLSAIDFLCDSNQRYMTGQVIALSGGAILDN